jgi:co-chaperonin GroES (HSP10)
MMKMNNTQTIEVPDAVKAKMAAEAAEAEPIAKTNKREVSDEEWEAQMPKPSGYRLLIALPDVEEYYQGSTLLKTTDQMHKEYIMSIMGIVIDMGADAYSDKDRFPEGPWCKEGDYVMFRMNTGTRFKVNGKEFRLMNDDSVEAVIPDPRGIMAV